MLLLKYMYICLKPSEKLLKGVSIALKFHWNNLKVCGKSWPLQNLVLRSDLPGYAKGWDKASGRSPFSARSAASARSGSRSGLSQPALQSRCVSCGHATLILRCPAAICFRKPGTGIRLSGDI